MGNLSIGDLTTGIDSNGMESYIDTLKASLITETKDKIDDISAIQSSIDAGWQGVAKDRFMKDFEEARKLVKEDLEKEYENLENRLAELQAQYFEADQNMIVEE